MYHRQAKTDIQGRHQDGFRDSKGYAQDIDGNIVFAAWQAWLLQGSTQCRG